MLKRMLWAAFLAVLVVACTTNVPVPTASTPVQTDVPPTEVPASATPVPPTQTAVPPTKTPIPASPTPTLTATPVLQASGPDNFPQGVNPLTGLKLSSPQILDRRPLSVKIQMFPRGQRPPFGASLADIVFDYYANNGATRLNAIFYGQDAERVSPIRSARLLDISIVQMYQAIFAFGGADERILRRIQNSDISNRMVLEGRNNCPPMCRVDPNTFNYLVVDTAELTKYAEANGINNDRPDLEGMSFDPQEPAGGQAVEQVLVRYNTGNYNRWDYDPATGRYLRFQEKADDTGQGESFDPLVDGLTEEQITAANVVVLYALHTDILPSPQNEIIDINLIGTGTAYVFRDGQAYEVRWSRPSTGSVIFLTTPSGEPFPFKPGNTWFQVLGQATRLEKEVGGSWRFMFGMP